MKHRPVSVLVEITAPRAVVLYALTRLAVQELRLNIDEQQADLGEEAVEMLTLYINEGERFISALSKVYPDLKTPFIVGGKSICPK